MSEVMFFILSVGVGYISELMFFRKEMKELLKWRSARKGK